MSGVGAYSRIRTDPPDWVIIGTPNNWRGPDGKPVGGVMVIASTELSYAQLEVVREDLTPDWDGETWDPPPIRLGKAQTTLTCGLGKFVVIYADTYEAAFTRLRERWNPDQPTPAQIGGQPLEITP